MSTQKFNKLTVSKKGVKEREFEIKVEQMRELNDQMRVKKGD